MRILLSTFLLFAAACAGSSEQANSASLPVTDPDYDCPVQTDLVESGFSTKVEVGVQTAVFNGYIPFEYERGHQGFSFSHPGISLQYNSDQGLLLKGDIPKNDDGDFEKFAILIRKEQLAALEDPEVADFVSQVMARVEEQYADVDPTEFGQDKIQQIAGSILMEFVQGINEDGYSPSACLYQLALAVIESGEGGGSCCPLETCENISVANIWQEANSEYLSLPVTITFPKEDGLDIQARAGASFNAVTSEPIQQYSWTETDEGWVYSFHIVELVFNYLSQTLPVGFEASTISIEGWTPILSEAWVSVQLPSISAFQGSTRGFLSDGMNMLDEFTALARSNGHLTKTSEEKIAEANYRQKVEAELGGMFEEMNTEYQGNLGLQWMMGSEVRFGLRTSDHERFENSADYFEYEIPSDRQVIELIPMIDMFARMGLMQMAQ